MKDLSSTETQASASIQEEARRWTQEASHLKELDTAFGRGGIQSFALEGVLGELQVMFLTIFIELALSAF